MYNIHPTQFDTPMPTKYDEDIDFSLLLWDLQDRTCQHKNSNNSEDSIRNLFSEVLKADRELRRLINDMPGHGKPQSEILYLELANTLYSIHRHFQIQSLQDPSFSYTMISCLPFMHRHLSRFLSLAANPQTQVISSLWTTNTYVLTGALWLLLVLIFSKEGMPQIYEAAEIRELAAKSLEFLRINQQKTWIARRGVTLIETFLEIDQAVLAEGSSQLSLRDITSRVIQNDQNSQVTESECSQTASVEPSNASLLDLVSGDGVSWEEVMSAFY
ncbi:C6 transcription factor [Penicillium malachiteum]|nr:C6 transcription factor [Penicillium malachiteum]